MYAHHAERQVQFRNMQQIYATCGAVAELVHGVLRGRATLASSMRSSHGCELALQAAGKNSLQRLQGVGLGGLHRRINIAPQRRILLYLVFKLCQATCTSLACSPGSLETTETCMPGKYRTKSRMAYDMQKKTDMHAQGPGRRAG